MIRSKTMALLGLLFFGSGMANAALEGGWVAEHNAIRDVQPAAPPMEKPASTSQALPDDSKLAGQFSASDKSTTERALSGNIETFRSVEKYNAIYTNRVSQKIQVSSQVGDTCICGAIANLHRILNFEELDHKYLNNVLFGPDYIRTAQEKKQSRSNACVDLEFGNAFSRYAKEADMKALWWGQFATNRTANIQAAEPGEYANTESVFKHIEDAVDSGKVVVIGVDARYVAASYKIDVQKSDYFQEKHNRRVNNTGNREIAEISQKYIAWWSQIEPHVYIIVGLQRDSRGRTTHYWLADSDGDDFSLKVFEPSTWAKSYGQEVAKGRRYPIAADVLKDAYSQQYDVVDGKAIPRAYSAPGGSPIVGNVMIFEKVAFPAVRYYPEQRAALLTDIQEPSLTDLKSLIRRIPEDDSYENMQLIWADKLKCEKSNRNKSYICEINLVWFKRIKSKWLKEFNYLYPLVDKVSLDRSKPLVFRIWRSNDDNRWVIDCPVSPLPATVRSAPLPKKIDKSHPYCRYL